MKKLLLTILLVAVHFVASSQIPTYNFNNSTVEEALTTIEKQSGYRLFYEPAWVEMTASKFQDPIQETSTRYYRIY